MVAAQNIGHALRQPVPQAVPMRRGSDRRVHLRIAAQPWIGILRRQRQVLRRHFACRDILVPGNILQLRRGCHMQDVDSPPCFPGEADDPLRRDHRAFIVAPDGMRR